MNLTAATFTDADPGRGGGGRGGREEGGGRPRGWWTWQQLPLQMQTQVGGGGVQMEKMQELTLNRQAITRPNRWGEGIVGTGGRGRSHVHRDRAG